MTLAVAAMPMAMTMPIMSTGTGSQPSHAHRGLHAERGVRARSQTGSFNGTSVVMTLSVCFLMMLLGFDVCNAEYQCSQFDTSSSNCKCKFDDPEKTVIDFSYIAKNDGTPMFPFGTYGNSVKDYEYAFNPCVGFSSGNCKDVSVCQRNREDHTQSYPVGDVVPTDWTTAASELIVVTYASTYENIKRTSIVTFKCDSSATKAPTLSYHGESPTRTYNFTLDTCLACRERIPGCPNMKNAQPALTTGGILCIVFVVLLMVYFVGGMLYKRFAQGATGTEIIPNYEFWVDFPALIKDGFLFVTSSCRKDEYSQI